MDDGRCSQLATLGCSDADASHLPHGIGMHLGAVQSNRAHLEYADLPNHLQHRQRPLRYRQETAAATGNGVTVGMIARRDQAEPVVSDRASLRLQNTMACVPRRAASSTYSTRSSKFIEMDLRYTSDTEDPEQNSAVATRPLIKFTEPLQPQTADSGTLIASSEAGHK
ncbi:hypothetical protein NKJ93_30465 [Mesorhizobium sp. M0028]|uniref:hypothetical protein n=1 Tax=Mesorhizobium sp. M0028 TaxID=2956849 RepID=UPI003338A533